MKHLTVGTAGHVDHGKTALIGALTGIDTDRLEEEKARGISIVLGFAHLELSAGTVDFIDVPGHERFVKTMISGATGLGAVLLVVAADEGVMPQTVEHLEIAGLLGVQSGIVVVTKSDLIAEDERSLVLDDIRDLVGETFLADAPIIFTSTRSGEGLEVLKAHLDTLLRECAAPQAQPNAYLPIDRIFTASGFGTVVTGTLRRGTLRVGETLELTPGGLRAELRNLQVHVQSVTSAATGWRTAVNLRGLKRERLKVGDALATPGYLTPTRLYDAELRLLRSAPRALKNAERVRLAFGTTEVAARVRLLEVTALTPGETSSVQLRFDEEIAAPFREPFVIRGASPLRALGGGLLLGPQARKHRRFDGRSSAYVRALARGSVKEIVRERLSASGIAGYELAALARELGLTPERLGREEGLALTIIGGRVVSSQAVHDLLARTLEHVADFHAHHPTRYGSTREALRARLPPDVAPQVFAHLLAQLTLGGRLEAQENLVKLPEHDPLGKLSPAQEGLAAELEAAFARVPFQPPELATVLTDDPLRELYHVLVRRGRLVPTRDKDAVIVFHVEAVQTAKVLLARRFSKAPFTLSEARELLGTSRKYLLPLLDHLDAAGYTRREGSERFITGELPSDLRVV